MSASDEATPVMPTLEACLPASLRGPSTTITRVRAGLSGAGVYRIEAAGEAYVLKLSSEVEPVPAWQGKLAIQRLAADAGLAPPVVHADEARRAVLSAFVADRSFAGYYFDPSTRSAAIRQLGETLRRVHALPLPAEASRADARELLRSLWPTLAGLALPSFAVATVEAVLAEPAPPSERPLVLSHNDVNPTNIIYDGARLVLLDWDTAGANDPYFDLATISIFLRMDDAGCRDLLSAYAGAPCELPPARFAYDRRLASGACGVVLLGLARQLGHAGARPEDTLDSAPTIADVYQRARAGQLRFDTAEGQWAFGLALLKTSATLRLEGTR